jgi:hypothetical protein
MRLALLAALAALTVACGSQASQARPTPTGTPLAGNCHARIVEPKALLTLPDSRCTPGRADPRVTQASLFLPAEQSKPQQGLCSKGYSTSWVRPPQGYTDQLKRAQLGLVNSNEVYGYSDRHPNGYQEDHLIPLELGGDPRSVLNLWPEPATSFKTPKDPLETYLRNRVCYTRDYALASAQALIASDWVSAYRVAVEAPDWQTLSARPLYQ